MTGSTRDFYQQLAGDYHLIFADWEASIVRQGAVLDGLIRAFLPGPSLDLLDCSCGIGTQALGLAARGYRVHATDLSETAVRRAAAEAAARGLPLTTGVADFRALAGQVAGTFDVVLTCDNSLPHLLTDDDLHLAARNLRAKLRPGGLLLASIRDYDALRRDPPRATQPQVIDDTDGRRVVFQVWDWNDAGDGYTLTMFILRQQGGAWATSSYTATYRALLRAELTSILEAEGFTAVQWHMPPDTGFYQPIITARRPDPSSPHA